jgi:hypothetical protein
MKPEEETANKYLEQQGLGSPVFEPDGNIPPDFTLSRQIAIEVRRLNRTLSTNSITANEESIYIPFQQILNDVLSTFDSQYNGKSYWVGIEYLSPFSPKKNIKKQLYLKLKKFLNSQDIKLPCTLAIKDNDNDIVSLIIFESGKPITGCTFKSIGRMNYDIVDPITQMYIDNLQWSIIEKSDKIKPHKHKYPEWQLLLVDSLRWDLGIEEIEKIKVSITDIGLFDFLIVISYEAKLLFRI